MYLMQTNVTEVIRTGKNNAPERFSITSGDSFCMVISYLSDTAGTVREHHIFIFTCPDAPPKSPTNIEPKATYISIPMTMARNQNISMAFAKFLTERSGAENAVSIHPTIGRKKHSSSQPIHPDTEVALLCTALYAAPCCGMYDAPVISLAPSCMSPQTGHMPLSFSFSPHDLHLPDIR